MDIQVHNPMTPEKFLLDPSCLEVSQDISCLMFPDKPVGKNLFWTSTLRGNTSEWMEWCSSESPSWIGSKAFLFRVLETAKVAHIRSIQDYDVLLDRFQGHISFPGVLPDRTFLDWAALAKVYDGVHVDVSYGEMLCSNLYGWDSESTVWFRAPRVLVFERKVSVINRPEDGRDMCLDLNGGQ